MANLTKPAYITIDTVHVNFSSAINRICMPVTATFTDLSVNAISWYWRFGNGDTSVLQNPVYTYDSIPTSPVSLTITDNHGCSGVYSQPAFVPLNGTFTAQSDSGCAPFTASFSSDTAFANAWYWNFGDGTSSTLHSPSHTYATAGNYDVTLIITSGQYQCSDTLTMPQLIRVKQPSAAFSTPNLSGCAPLVVNFTSNSLDVDSYLWEFGDSTTSTNQNPAHIYNRPGIYSVSLIASNLLGCSDTLVKSQYIRVLGPITNFTASAFSGCDPFLVDFSDLSQDAVNWSWFFGDGYASTSQNPAHLYQDTGSFTASLVTHDTAGCASYYELPQQIVVYPIPRSSFTTNDTIGCEPYVVSFTNTSVSNDSSHWDFGDGSTSSQNNPAHTYTTAGVYAVRLVTRNLFGCADTFTTNRPIVINATPQPAFSSDTSQGCAGFSINFQDLSTHLVQPAYLWDFGNGVTSTLPNPVVGFTNPGFYDVTLSITNANGCANTVMLPAYIHVFDTLPPPISEILSVSVTSNTTVEINWQVNPAIDLGAYKLFRFNPATNTYDNIFTVLDPNNTSFALNPMYRDTGLNTLQNTYSYKLQALDFCDYAIDLSQLTSHTTINVSSQRAGQFINVWWSAYGGCAVNNYMIYRSYPGSNPQWIATVPANQFTYLDTTFDCPYAYSYRITAMDLCGRPYTSNSDTSVTEPFNFLANQVVDVVRSTVVDNQTVLTEWLAPEVHPEKVADYEIYRSTDNHNFIYRARVPSEQTDFMDDQVNVLYNHYYYKIRVHNTCDINEDPSINTSTILLKGIMNDDRSVRLEWSPYIGWDQDVDYYIIEQRDINGEWILLKQVDGATNQYDFQE